MNYDDRYMYGFEDETPKLASKQTDGIVGVFNLILLGLLYSPLLILAYFTSKPFLPVHMEITTRLIVVVVLAVVYAGFFKAWIKDRRKQHR